MNTVRSILFAAVASFAITGNAFARDAVFSAKLEAPAPEQTRVIVQNAVWICRGDTCLARPGHASTVRSCRQFVREIGVRVSAYGPENDQLSADEIARCNGDSGAQQAQR